MIQLVCLRLDTLDRLDTFLHHVDKRGVLFQWLLNELQCLSCISERSEELLNRTVVSIPGLVHQVMLLELTQHSAVEDDRMR